MFKTIRQLEAESRTDLLNEIDAIFAEKALEQAQEVAQAIQEAQDTGESHDR